MKIPAKVIKFIDSSKIKYEVLNHKTAYTAYDKAATLKIKPNMVAKTLVLKADKNLILALIPGNKNLDFGKIKKTGKIKKIDFISETIIKNKFKGVKIGAIPPMGDLWKLPIFVDNSLLKLPKVIISAGVHESSFELKGKDLGKLNPNMASGSFSKPKK